MLETKSQMEIVTVVKREQITTISIYKVCLWDLKKKKEKKAIQATFTTTKVDDGIYLFDNYENMVIFHRSAR